MKRLRFARISQAIAVVVGVALASFAWAASASAASAPSIEGESVSHITATDATLEARVNPNGLQTQYEFWLMFANCQNPPPGSAECESISVQRVGEGEIPAGSTSQSVSAQLTGLHRGYSYTFWAVATNSSGETVGEYQKFSAQSALPPAIESEAVSHITPTDATLEATINTDGAETTYEFQLLGRTWCELLEPSCLPPIRDFPLPSGKLLGSFVGQTVSLDLNSAGVTLSPGHNFYEYSVRATNAAGTTEGQPQRFSTPSEAGVEPLNEPTEPTAAAEPQSSTTIQLPSSTSLSHHKKHKGRRHRRRTHRARQRR